MLYEDGIQKSSHKQKNKSGQVKGKKNISNRITYTSGYMIFNHLSVISLQKEKS